MKSRYFLFLPRASIQRGRDFVVRRLDCRQGRSEGRYPLRSLIELRTQPTVAPKNDDLKGCSGQRFLSALLLGWLSLFDREPSSRFDLRRPALAAKYLPLCILVLIWIGAWSAKADVELFPLSEIKPGMHGKTFTVMQGSEIVELETEILGVQYNGVEPGRHLIIGKLLDPKTALTGAVHGMSGSPLYINGKLVGALSRRLAIAEKDGHCGFTPIKDMLEVVHKPARSTMASRGPWLSPLQFGGSKQVTQSVFSKEMGSYLALPLSMTGWQPSWQPIMEKIFGNASMFIPTAASAGAFENPEKHAFEVKPGSPLAVILVSGDVTASAVGTVTWIKDKKFAAFGHPMSELGATALPVAGAEIISVIPSYVMPYKLSNAGKIVGTLEQDRVSAVTGVLDKLPSMAQYEIKRVHQGEKQKTWNGAFVSERSTAPSLVALLLTAALFEQQNISTDFYTHLHAQVEFDGLPPLQLQGVYSGNLSDRYMALFDQIDPLISLYSQFGEQLRVKSLKMEVMTEEQTKIWRLIDLKVAKQEFRLDEKLFVTMLLRNLKGEEKEVQAQVEIPEELKQKVFRLNVVSGQDLTRREQANRAAQDLSPQEMISLFSHSFDAQSLYIECITDAQGASVKGRLQPNLPTSVLNVLNGGIAKPYVSGLSEKIWMRQQVQFSGVVKGAQSIEIEVLP